MPTVPPSRSPTAFQLQLASSNIAVACCHLSVVQLSLVRHATTTRSLEFCNCICNCCNSVCLCSALLCSATLLCSALLCFLLSLSATLPLFSTCTIRTRYRRGTPCTIARTCKASQIDSPPARFPRPAELLVLPLTLLGLNAAAPASALTSPSTLHLHPHSHAHPHPTFHEPQFHPSPCSTALLRPVPADSPDTRRSTLSSLLPLPTRHNKTTKLASPVCLSTTP